MSLKSNNCVSFKFLWSCCHGLLQEKKRLEFCFKISQSDANFFVTKISSYLLKRHLRSWHTLKQLNDKTDLFIPLLFHTYYNITISQISCFSRLGTVLILLPQIKDFVEKKVHFVHVGGGRSGSFTFMIIHSYLKFFYDNSYVSRYIMIVIIVIIIWIRVHYFRKYSKAVNYYWKKQKQSPRGVL